MHIYTKLYLMILTTLILCGCATQKNNADVSDCGPGYFKTLPCLPGGQRVEVPDRYTITPSIVLSYARAPDYLAKEFLRSARKSGWHVSGLEIANEPGGLRYRSKLTKGKAYISMTVFPNDDRSWLALMVFNRGEE